MHSPNLTQDNIARIREMFPSFVTEVKGSDGTLKLTLAGTPNNTRKLAQIDKKKPQLITVGASVLVEQGGVEPPSESTLPLVLHA